jgi:hypothetical protein
MNRPTRRRLPWEKDPNDREANYRKPIAQDEKVRLTAKGASVLAGFFFIMTMTEDRVDVGAEFAIGIGAPLLLAGVLDVIWTLRGRLEHVFLESKASQLAAHGAMALVGGALLVAGVVGKGA